MASVRRRLMDFTVMTRLVEGSNNQLSAFCVQNTVAGSLKRVR